MNRSTFAPIVLGALGLLAPLAQAAPGLVVDGTEFKYNGSKIFFSGMNLAWVNYNSDVGADALDENAWRAAVEGTRAAGGNVIRWWLFNNMSTSPLVGSDHLVSGLPAKTIDNMKKALDIAEEYGVMVSMCLFSHNLMEKCQWGLYENATMKSTCEASSGTTLNYSSFVDIEANKKLFTDAGTTAFIEKALKPVLEGVGNHKALMTWELFNEPEGMTTEGNGWTSEKLAIADVQKFGNKVAAAIKTYDNTLLVSNGIHNAGAFKYWTDEALVAAGGESKGVLDFYQVHFYPEHQTSAQNPFEHPASYWTKDGTTNGTTLGKPIVIGEFSAGGWNKEKYPAYKVPTMTTVQAFNYAYDNGYAGAMAWDINGFNDIVAKTAVTHNLAAATPGLQALYNSHEQYIKIKDYTAPVLTGNGVMEVSYANVDGADGATLEYKSPTVNLKNNSVVTFMARVTDGDAIGLSLVTKSGGWNWVQNDASCELPASGEWVTCSFDLVNDYTGVAISNVQSFLLRTFNSGYTGTIQIDAFKAGSLNIVDFDTQYDVFSIAADMAGGDAITSIKTVYIDPTPALNVKKAAQWNMHYGKGIVHLDAPIKSAAQFSLYSINGVELRSQVLHAGSQAIVLGSLPTGIYHVRLQSQGVKTTASFVVQ